MRNVIKNVRIINYFHHFKYLKGSKETTCYLFIKYLDYSIMSPTGTYGVFSMLWLTREQVTVFVAE